MARAFRDTPWPVLLLVVSFLAPTELSVWVGGARLPPHRALLLILLPITLVRLGGPRGMSPRPFDVAFLLFAAWTLLVYVHHHGVAGGGLQTGGALALDSFASFLVARAHVRDQRTFAATAGVVFMAVAVSGLIALPEMLGGQIFVHDFLRQATGYVHPTGVEKRLGLTRAFGTFDHPIHLGTFCAAGLALAIYSAGQRGQVWLRALVIPASALTGLSSAPMLSLAVQGVLMAAEKATRGIKGRVYLGAGLVLALFLAASLVATRSPFAVIATGFTLDSWTGFYRLMIWESGLANVWSSPWTGIGLNDWERPQWMVSSTIDAFWLVVAVRQGVPAVVLLAVAIVLLGRGVGRRIRRADRDTRLMATGWMISLTALLLVACTVHYWNVPYAYFFFFLGLGGWMADPLRQARPAAVAKKPVGPAARIAWVAPGATMAAGPRGQAPAGPMPRWASGPPRWPVPQVKASTR